MLTEKLRAAVPGAAERVREGGDAACARILIEAAGKEGLKRVDLEPFAARALKGAKTADEFESVCRAIDYPAIRAVALNPDGMARMRLKNTFEKLLTEDDVQALAPDILAALKTPCPADTMFGNEIRMGAFKALTKYHFQEGIEAGVLFAKTQGGHGSESRTGVIMKEIKGYGSAAREALPGLKMLITFFNDQCKRGEFPAGELNNRRIAAVEDAIQVIEAAKDQPPLRSITPDRNK